MSTSYRMPGSPSTGATTCYRSTVDRSHRHRGPFVRCGLCHRTICQDCVGRHHPSGGVICVECSGLVYHHAFPVPPAVTRRAFAASAGPALRSLGAALGRAAGGAWRGLRRIGRELLRPYRPQPPTPGRLQADLRVWWIDAETVFQAAIALVFSLAAIGLAALVYGMASDIPFPRVLVAIVGAATFWAIVAGQILFRVRHSLGDLVARVYAFLLAFLLAAAFGAWLIHWSWLDRLF